MYLRKIPRNHLKEAEELCRNGLYEDATAEIALAFEIMLADYESSRKEPGLGSPFFFGKDMSFLSSFHLGINKIEQRTLAQFVDTVKESIEAIQHAIKIIAFGLDYKKYTKFKSLLPHIYRMRPLHNSSRFFVLGLSICCRKDSHLTITY